VFCTCILQARTPCRTTPPWPRFAQLERARSELLDIPEASLDASPVGGPPLAIKDNAGRLSASVQTRRPSHGHSGMRERFRLLVRALDVQCAPGTGTTVVAWTPIPKAAP
jgi:hypothetical protein